MADKITYTLHTSNGFEKSIAHLPAVQNNNIQQNDFTSSNYRGGFWDGPEDDNPLMWRPLSGYGWYDRLSSMNVYRSYAYAAINKAAFNLAKANIYIYKEFKSKTTEQERHPFLDLIKSNNIYGQSFKEILFLTAVNLKLPGGECFWHVVTVKTPFGAIPTEIRCLVNSQVEPVYNKENTLIEYYWVNNIKFNKDEIIHFKNPNPSNPNRGFSPCDAFNFTLDIEYLQGRFSKSVFNNNANLEGVLETDKPMSTQAHSQLQEEWNSKYTGHGNQGKTPILQGGLHYTRVQGNPRELDFKETRLQIRDEIFVILDVPKTVMNVSDDVNYNNSQSALRSFIENTIQPYCAVVLEPAINNYFKKFYGEKFLLKMEYEFVTDREQQLRTLDLYLRHNVIKKEVIAEQEGYSPDDVPEQVEFKPIEENAESN